jgi:hypothetical protein
MKMAAIHLASIKRFCLRNPALRLLSLAVAVCIWSFTAISREARNDLVLPVELRNIPPGYGLAKQPPQEIRFTLSGPAILIDGARRANAAMIINLRGAGPGKTLFSNLETNLKIPEGIKVTRIYPAVLEIELTRIQTYPTQGEP